MDKCRNFEVEKSVRSIQSKLSAVEQLQEKSLETDNILSQISIATILKTETNYCYADRRSPILCALKIHSLSDGKSTIICNLKNRSGYDLTDWLVIFDFIPLKNGTVSQLSDNLKPKIISSVVHKLSAIKNSSSAQIYLFSTDNYNEIALINCYLVKKFQNFRTEDGCGAQKEKIFQILIEKCLLTILDHVNYKSRPTFIPQNLYSENDRSDEQDRFFFNFHYSFLRLIGKNRIVENFESLCKIVLEWLFPHLTELFESSTSSVSDEKSSLTYDNLSLSCAADLYLQFQHLEPLKLRLNFSITSKFCRDLSRSLRKAVLSKYLFIIEDFLNVPTSVELDIQDIRASLEYVEQNAYLDDNSDTTLKYLFNSHLSHLSNSFTFSAIMERLANKKAFIVGYTGEVGKQLVKELLEKKVFLKLVLLGRRKVDFPQDEAYAKAEQIEIDFDNVDKFKDHLKDCEFGFCCLGTTRSKAGVNGFVKVDHDYVVNIAKVAAENGCQHFSVVSSAGTDKNSSFLYPRTKGLMEEDVSKLSFMSVSIFRPKLLLANRQENRLLERAAIFILTPITKLAPTVVSVPTSSVAKAMIFRAAECAKAILTAANKAEIIDNKTIHQMSASWDEISKN
uniref:Protein HTATIP2 n=1 Tax=Romanomermis culicivorax TaxID=13658 RepID=A0A915IF84_ROMCU